MLTVQKAAKEEQFSGRNKHGKAVLKGACKSSLACGGLAGPGGRAPLADGRSECLPLGPVLGQRLAVVVVALRLTVPAAAQAASIPLLAAPPRASAPEGGRARQAGQMRQARQGQSQSGSRGPQCSIPRSGCTGTTESAHT